MYGNSEEDRIDPLGGVRGLSDRSTDRSIDPFTRDDGVENAGGVGDEGRTGPAVLARRIAETAPRPRPARIPAVDEAGQVGVHRGGQLHRRAGPERLRAARGVQQVEEERKVDTVPGAPDHRGGPLEGVQPGAGTGGAARGRHTRAGGPEQGVRHAGARSAGGGRIGGAVRAGLRVLRRGTADELVARRAEQQRQAVSEYGESFGDGDRQNVVADDRAQREDYTYGRPARRSAALPGVVLPSLRRRPPRVSVIIDTSGSVSDTELGSALLEVTAISRAVGGRRDLVTVLPCDAAAQVVHPLCRAEGIPLMGGGGTDLRTGFDRALRANPRPDVVVVLIDGQTPWPDTRPACRTVVGLFPRQRAFRGRQAARSWDGDEEEGEYVPGSPPAWARVVDIGSVSTGRQH